MLKSLADLVLILMELVCIWTGHPGNLSFYTMSSSGTLTHFYTRHTTFTEPLYPGFWFGVYSSVTLC
jgi:hypothetical protein